MDRNTATGLGSAWALFSMVNPLKLANPVIYFASVAVSFILAPYFQPKNQKTDADSQSYNWKRPGNLTASNNLPIPVVYGKTRVTPVIKNQFMTIGGDGEYLNTLYSFTGHKIDEIDVYDVAYEGAYSTTSPIVKWSSLYPGQTFKCIRNGAIGSWIQYIGRTDPPYDVLGSYWMVWHGTGAITDIEINGNTIDDSITGNNDNINYETRPGLANQVLIDGFDRTYSNLPQTTTLSLDSWVTVQTSSLVAQNIEVTVSFPSGLYGYINSNRLVKRDVRIDLVYREIGTTRWLRFEDKDWNQIQGAYSKYINEFNYAMSYMIFQERIQPFRVTFKAKPKGEYLDTEKQYEIMIRKRLPNGELANSVTTVELTNVATISYAQDSDSDGEIDGLVYPGESLLGMKIRATEELHGSIDLTGVVERSTVKVHNGTSWVNMDANIHAWAVYDILANGHPDHPCYPNTTNDADEIMGVYGAGVSYERLDYASFLTWANATGPDGLDYELNIVFDSFTTIWDAILKICIEGRGIVFPVGSKYKALPDIPTDATNLFSMGNIDLGTFKKQWIDKAKKANTIEITFFDEDRDYERSTFVVRTSDWDTSTELKDAIRLSLNGTTNYNQAVGLGIYYLNCNELLNQAVSFISDVEALDLEVGDVLYVQHDTLTGTGGKVVSYNAGTGDVTLDKAITMVTGKTYELYIQHSDGTIDHKYPFSGNGSFTILTGTGWTTNPALHDNWAFGETGKAVKLFRVVDISRDSEYKRIISCLEYNEAVYDSRAGGDLGTANVPKIAPDRDQPDRKPFNTASSLSVYEVLSRNRATGEYESSISVSWQPDEGDPTGEWEVSYRDVDANDPDWKGEWDTNIPYDKYERVEHNGYTYISLSDTNLGIEPVNI